jgi:hypothetical protein
MGTPRILYAKLACSRCNNEQRFVLQFHTDRYDDDERYESGELIDDPALPRGSVFEASLWCYCDDCMRSWKVDRSTTYYEVLAQLSSSERIFVRRGDDIVNAEDLVAQIGSAEVDAGGGVSNFPAWLGRLNLSIHPPRRIVVGCYEDIAHEHEAIEQLYQAGMRSRGWPFGGEFIRYDAEVRVTADGRITHKVPNQRDAA